MTNPDNVGVLQRYAAVFVDDDPKKELLFIAKSKTGNLVMYDDAIAYGELCRAAPAGSGEVEDWMVELFDEVYEREWNRAADEADDRHKAIIGPADRHATREAIAAILRKLSTAGSGEVEARDAYSRIIKALAAIACVHTPDDLFDLNAIPRDPVMLQVMRIRQAADDLSALLRKLQQGADVIDEAREATSGHCEHGKKPGGCPFHNLQCGYPDCDRRPA